MIDILNIVAAVITIGLGCFGWLAPRYTASALDLQTGATTMGLSELRASVGCLFVALGAGAIVLGTPMAYFMMGVAYAGATVGRGSSALLDDPPKMKVWTYFAIEAALAGWLILANWGAVSAI
ncbi:DUF4345 family protein [Actibacterium sp. 188UL27-1]|uniref:DUF4345 family protein n=1 Tax=Actibacterium sp. 188UL27-1 TaxID=2786961 RepID=UPI0019578168|nr:DUF4345 family protein [Actibacterium sp. 188UL27-1]MBM7067885.1 DUF4345 family protein [Actibacterium sp. 188UL27-1]